MTSMQTSNKASARSRGAPVLDERFDDESLLLRDDDENAAMWSFTSGRDVFKKRGLKSSSSSFGGGRSSKKFFVLWGTPLSSGSIYMLGKALLE